MILEYCQSICQLSLGVSLPHLLPDSKNSSLQALLFYPSPMTWQSELIQIPGARDVPIAILSILISTLSYATIDQIFAITKQSVFLLVSLKYEFWKSAASFLHHGGTWEISSKFRRNFDETSMKLRWDHRNFVEVSTKLRRKFHGSFNENSIKITWLYSQLTLFVQ